MPDARTLGLKRATFPDLNLVEFEIRVMSEPISKDKCRSRSLSLTRERRRIEFTADFTRHLLKKLYARRSIGSGGDMSCECVQCRSLLGLTFLSTIQRPIACLAIRTHLQLAGPSPTRQMRCTRSLVKILAHSGAIMKSQRMEHPCLNGKHCETRYFPLP